MRFFGNWEFIFVRSLTYSHSVNNSYRKNFPRLTFLKFQVENTHFLIGLSVYNLNFKGLNFGLRLWKKFKKSIQQVDDKLKQVFSSQAFELKWIIILDTMKILRWSLTPKKIKEKLELVKLRSRYNGSFLSHIVPQFRCIKSSAKNYPCNTSWNGQKLWTMLGKKKLGPFETMCRNRSCVTLALSFQRVGSLLKPWHERSYTPSCATPG